jgi:hypothetical protein
MKRNLNEPKLVENICMTLDRDQRAYCLDGMVSYYMVHYYSFAKGKDLCSQLLEENRILCLSSVQKRKSLFPDGVEQ